MSVIIDLIGEIAGNHFQHARTTQWWDDSNQKFSSVVTQAFNDLNCVFKVGTACEVSIRSVDFGFGVRGLSIDGHHA